MQLLAPSLSSEMCLSGSSDVCGVSSDQLNAPSARDCLCLLRYWCAQGYGLTLHEQGQGDPKEHLQHQALSGLVERFQHSTEYTVHIK